MQENRLPASVAICTKNRSRTLERCLASLACQSVPDDSWELVIVNDHSVDDTMQVCTEYAESVPFKVNVLSSEPSSRSLAEARNTALRACKGDIVLWIDDDCIAEPDWIEKMSAGLQEHDFVAGGIESPRRPYMKLAHNVTEFHDFMHYEAGPIDFAAGANMGFRKEHILALGGFDSGIVCAEDMALLMKYRASGGVVHYMPDAVVLHDHSRVRLTEIISYSYEHAQTTIGLRAKNPTLTGTPSIMLSPWTLRVLSVPVAVWSTIRMFGRRDGVSRYAETAPVVFMTKVAWCMGAARGLERA